MMSDLIHYSIRPSFPEAHIFSVTLMVKQPDEAGQVLSLPAWIPGSYMIRDFARHIVSIRASCEGEAVVLAKLDKLTWQAGPVCGTLLVTYEVYAWDLSVRGAHLDTSHGFFNGTSVFMQVVGQEHTAVVVLIDKPEGIDYLPWKAATSMPERSVDRQGFGSYVASNYQHLIDYPVEMGNYQELKFQVQGIPHRMAITGRCSVDVQRIAQDLQKICTHHAQFFGELPLTRYLFLTMVVGDGYGGLEHRDSTSLMCKRDDLPVKDMAEITKGYRGFLGLCSHEYFHLWNVKRIRPELLKRASLSQEVHTKLLWAFEGITSYYDDLALVRSGCIEPSSYLDLMAQTVTRVMRGTGRLKQSIAESSFDAWTRFYKQDENAPNAIVSYYTKGSLVAFGLDMLLRDVTNDVSSLDKLMRTLWERHGKPDIGVPEDGLEKLASELAGCDLSDYFNQAVHDTADLSLADWFASVGIGYRLRPAKNQEDWGGHCDDPAENKPRQDIGVRYKQQGDMVVLTHVLDAGAAQAAGLAAGDKLVAIDGLQVSAVNLEPLVAQSGKGEEISVHAFRRDELMTFQLLPKVAPSDTCELRLLPDDECIGRQLLRRREWLSLA
jgi:predicted metalloprotease with PDZ domain